MVDTRTTDTDRTISVPLNPQAEQILKDVRELTGMIQKSFVKRLLEWYAAQPKSVQKEIRDLAGDPAGELVRLRLGEIAAAKAKDAGALAQMSIDETLGLIKILADHATEISRGHRAALAEQSGKKSKSK